MMITKRYIKQDNPISSSINSKLNNKHTMLLELDDKTPNITNNDIINSSSNIRKWNMTIQ